MQELLKQTSLQVKGIVMNINEYNDRYSVDLAVNGDRSFLNVSIEPASLQKFKIGELAVLKIIRVSTNGRTWFREAVA